MSLASLFRWDSTGVARSTVDRKAFYAAVLSATANIHPEQTIMVITDPITYTPSVEEDGCMVATSIPARFLSNVTNVRYAISKDIPHSVAALQEGDCIEVKLACGAWGGTTVSVVLYAGNDLKLCVRTSQPCRGTWDMETLFAVAQGAHHSTREHKRRRHPVYSTMHTSRGGGGGGGGGGKGGVQPRGVVAVDRSSRLLAALATDAGDADSLMHTNYENGAKWDIEDSD